MTRKKTVTKRQKRRSQNEARNPRPIHRQRESDPVLRFTPYAWAKLQFLCHHGDTEIGGFGITETGDLLLVEDVQTIQQSVSEVTVAFDDEAVADFFDTQIDAGRQPQQFARLWMHTHPGSSAAPSGTDEETFARVFGGCDWAVMFILARGGETYARLRFGAGPGGAMLIAVTVDYGMPFPPSDHDVWQAEYEANVHETSDLPGFAGKGSWDDDWFDELDPTIEVELLEREEMLAFEEDEVNL